MIFLRIMIFMLKRMSYLFSDIHDCYMQDYIDPMTMMPVVKPAISPYGHVMGYDVCIQYDVDMTPG